MDDIAARQSARTSEGGLFMRHRSMSAYPFGALGLDFCSTFTYNGARHAAAMLQLCIGRVNDCVDMLSGQVASHDLQRALVGQEKFGEGLVHRSKHLRADQPMG